MLRAGIGACMTGWPDMANIHYTGAQQALWVRPSGSGWHRQRALLQKPSEPFTWRTPLLPKLPGDLPGTHFLAYVAAVGKGGGGGGFPCPRQPCDPAHGHTAIAHSSHSPVTLHMYRYRYRQKAEKVS